MTTQISNLSETSVKIHKTTGVQSSNRITKNLIINLCSNLLNCKYLSGILKIHKLKYCTYVQRRSQDDLLSYNRMKPWGNLSKN